MASKNGQMTFNFALLVPAENTAAVEEIIEAHAAWMKETHLVDDHVAKGEEANDLLDPSKGTTGNVLYCINEVYVEADGIEQHMGQAMQWDGLEAFAGTLMQYGKVLIGGGSVIHSMNG